MNECEFNQRAHVIAKLILELDEAIRLAPTQGFSREQIKEMEDRLDGAKKNFKSLTDEWKLKTK